MKLHVGHIISNACYIGTHTMELRQDSIGFLMADVSRLMRQSFQKRMEGSSLTMAQARALFYVSRHEGVRQVDLAELLEV